MSNVIDGEVVKEQVAEPTADVQSDLRQAREMIPVTPIGASPVNFQQQIDFAQSMAKAVAAIPEFLQGNVGDCLAIVDIATRAGLSPYMLATKAYVQNKRLCFESQAYHALAIPYIVGDFDIAYEGDGEDTVCIISARLKNDAGKVRSHRSEKLSAARPKLNEHGQVKGSPLWTKKPRVQLAYDTMRDWVRLYAPRATLGIYVPEELIETPIGAADRARDVTSGVVTRTAALPRGVEGHQDGYAERELAQIAPKATTVLPAKKNSPKKSAAKKAEEEKTSSPEVATTNEGAATTARPQNVEPVKDQAVEGGTSTGASDTFHVKHADDTAQKATEELPRPTHEATGASEYVTLWEARIKAADSVMLIKEWKDERSVREKLGVDVKDVDRLRGLVDAKVAKLREQSDAG